jgi:hypothetical protein
MSYDFPSNPLVDQEYVEHDSSFKYDGFAWKRKGGPAKAKDNPALYGDIKQGFQATDHAGWIRLDGRAVSILTPGQQQQALILGFATNLPNATDAVPVQNGDPPGTISGSMSKTIAVSNLPAHNMTSNSVGNHAHTATTDSQGSHRHNTRSNDPNDSTNNNTTVYNFDSTDFDMHPIHNNHSWFSSNKTDRYRRDKPWHFSAGAHVHNLTTNNIGAHQHSISLGGGGQGLDITPRTLSVNCFVFLGD